jgi:hypothetical protein
MLYSASTGGFYSRDIHGSNTPGDVVEITEEEHSVLLAGQSLGQIIAPDSNGHPALHEPVIAAPTVANLCASIDAAADAARSKVAGDPLRAVEYEKSATEAAAFKAAGYPADAVPRTVSAWAISGRTAKQAADSILVEAAAYNEALYQIRETRLSAKEQVRQAMAANQVEQAQSIAAATIAGIRAAISGIGNAGA